MLLVEMQINSERYGSSRKSLYGVGSLLSPDNRTLNESNQMSIESKQFDITMLNSFQIIASKSKAPKQLDHILKSNLTKSVTYRGPEQLSQKQSPRETRFLPAFQSHRPFTSAAGDAKSIKTEPDYVNESSFAKNGSYLKQRYLKKEANSSQNLESTEHERDTEVLLAKLSQKAKPKSKKKPIRFKDTARSGGRTSQSSASTNTRAIFKEYDSSFDDVFAPTFFTTSYVPPNGKSDYHYDAFKVNIPSFLVESKKP